MVPSRPGRSRRNASGELIRLKACAEKGHELLKDGETAPFVRCRIVRFVCGLCRPANRGAREEVSRNDDQGNSYSETWKQTWHRTKAAGIFSRLHRSKRKYAGRCDIH